MSNRRKTNNFAKPDPIPYVRGLAVLMPEELIECALIRYGRKERRRRKLPARCVVWVVVLMSLLADESIPQVFRALHPSRDSPDPTESAFTKARHRLGVSVMRKLFYSISCQLAPLDLPGVCYRRWRLMGIDGAEIDMPDTPENGRLGETSRPVSPAFKTVRETRRLTRLLNSTPLVIGT